MSKKQPKRNPRRAAVISKISASASMDDRLTYASMMLGYVFKYGIDFQRRIINLTGEIDAEMFDKIDRAMTALESESRSAITIKINSPGGYTYQAMAIVGRLRESKCRIITRGYGEIMSAATLILACGDKRTVSRLSTFMYHEPSYEPGYDRHSTHKDYVQQADKENKQWAEVMGEFTGKTAKFWLEAGARKDTYFTAEQLVDLGVADETF